MSNLNPAPSHLDSDQDDAVECLAEAQRREEALRDAAMMAPEPDFSRLKLAIAKLDAAFAAGARDDG